MLTTPKKAKQTSPSHTRNVKAPAPPLSFGLNHESAKHLTQLIAAAESQGLVLFIGAGVNGTAVYQWNKLLSSLLAPVLGLAKMEDPRISQVSQYLSTWFGSHFDVCSQASVIKQVLGSNRYLLELQHAIYNRASTSEAALKAYCKDPPTTEDHPRKPDFEFLFAVARLCDSPHVKAIATFNFDTFLETAIKAATKRRPRSHHGQATVADHDSSPVDLPVFHIHGLLSPPGAPIRNPADSVVFSYDEYFDKNAAPLSWETSTPLHLLRNYSTLWLGTSMRDWNMLRLLEAAQPESLKAKCFCIQSLQEISNNLALRPPIPQAKQSKPRYLRDCEEFYNTCKTIRSRSTQFKKVAMRFQATLLESVGVNLIVAGDEYADVPEIITKRITPHLLQSSASKTPTAVSQLTRK